jgi:hypothetical protein
MERDVHASVSLVEERRLAANHCGGKAHSLSGVGLTRRWTLSRQITAELIGT